MSKIFSIFKEKNIMENWKVIPGHEKYEVSDLGRVKSYIKKNPKILKPLIDKKGYHSYNINGKIIGVHVLVGMAFLNHIPMGRTGFVIDHINNIKSDNRLVNLQRISHRDNLSKDKKRKYDLPRGVLKTKFNTYQATIKINSKAVHLGNFNTPEEASQAYQQKLKEIL